jgi:Cupin domain
MPSASAAATAETPDARVSLDSTTLASVPARLASGSLAEASAAPARGEHTVELVAAAGLVVEQILSGPLAGPADYLQDHDEWVVLLAGGARLRLDGLEHRLAAGDWLLIPAGCPHTLLATEPGTSWLAVHAPPAA